MAEKNMQVKTIAAVAGAVAAALLVVAFFLPYAAAVDEYREALGAMSANPYSETLGMSNEDLADISLFEYARIYSAAGELGMGDAFAAVYVPFTVAPAVLGVLTLLFAALRKPIPSMVFSVLTVAMTLLLNWDFEDRGVIPSDSYDWGVADSYESVNDVYRMLRVGPYAYLRDLNWDAFKERYLKYLWVLLGIIALGTIHILRTRRLVRLRTQQLSDALERQAKLEKDARVSRQRLSAVERAGVVSQMSSLLAHEVMQPLTALINFSSGLRTYTHQKFGSDSVVDHATEVITEEAQRILAIVERVRSYAKNQESPREHIRISEIVRDALHTFSHTTTAEGISIHTQERADPLVEVNRLELELVLVNLMKNAADAMENSAQKSLSIILDVDQSDMAIIEVVDTGGAIADETFRQLTLPIASIKEDGLGLGLSLCKSIAERHSGKLEFKRLDSGLSAAVKLPITEKISS